MAAVEERPTGRYARSRFQWRPSHRLVDAFIVVSIAAISVADLLIGSPDMMLALCARLCASAALWWRRRHPYVTYAVVISFVVLSTFAFEMNSLAIALVVAVYSIAKYGTMSRSLPAAAAAFVILLIPLIIEWVGVEEVVAVAAWILVPWLLGDRVRLMAERRAALLERIDDLEFDNDRRTREAITQERLRFARELHDVVSHSVSAIMLNAGGARSSSIEMDDDVRELFTTIELTARRELGEIRQLLHALRTGSDLADAGPSVHLMDVGQLADRHCVDDMEVRVTYGGSPRPLSPSVELAGYRIIHEALTNARTHGDATIATVDITFDDRSVRIAVRDNGGPSGSSEPSGLGLIGMRERVDLLSGTFKAGPTDDGFEVHAEIPATTQSAVLS